MPPIRPQVYDKLLPATTPGALLGAFIILGSFCYMSFRLLRMVIADKKREWDREDARLELDYRRARREEERGRNGW
jgi:hypothetical protein